MPEDHQQQVRNILQDDKVAELSKDLEPLSALERLQWSTQQHPKQVIATSSFGIHSAISLHLISQVDSAIPIVFIDTGYLFKETYVYAQKLTEVFNLDLRCYSPQITPAHQEALYGKRWESNIEELNHYLNDNKLEPMRRAIRELRPAIWISGLRRTQADTRKDRSVVEKQGESLKLYPIIDWDEAQVEAYMEEHQLPRHPLESAGYVSVGDWHSTTKLGSGMRAQDTRFGGMKRECGLHDNAKWKGSRT